MLRGLRRLRRRYSRLSRKGKAFWIVLREVLLLLVSDDDANGEVSLEAESAVGLRLYSREGRRVTSGVYQSSEMGPYCFILRTKGNS